MYSYATKIRIRYSETDKMGYVYYGNYAQFYEVGRVEMLRSLGFSYSDLEDYGIMMPVIDMRCHFIRPSFYDDELTIVTRVEEIPTTRIRFLYEIYGPDKKLRHEGETTLTFIHAKTRRPQKAPQQILDRVLPYFNQEKETTS